MAEKIESNQIFIPPWTFLAMGLVGVIAFILMLPLILGAFAVIGVFSGYLIWRVNQFFQHIEADHMWDDETERNQYSDQPVIDVTPDNIQTQN